MVYYVFIATRRWQRGDGTTGCRGVAHFILADIAAADLAPAVPDPKREEPPLLVLRGPVLAEAGGAVPVHMRGAPPQPSLHTSARTAAHCYEGHTPQQTRLSANAAALRHLMRHVLMPQRPVLLWAART